MIQPALFWERPRQTHFTDVESGARTECPRVHRALEAEPELDPVAVPPGCTLWASPCPRLRVGVSIKWVHTGLGRRGPHSGMQWSPDSYMAWSQRPWAAEGPLTTYFPGLLHGLRGSPEVTEKTGGTG